MATDTIVQFDFSEALTLLKDGKRVRRLGWISSRGHRLVFVDDATAHGWIFIVTNATEDNRPGNVAIVPVDWIPSQADILATDWVEVEALDKAESVS